MGGKPVASWASLPVAMLVVCVAANWVVDLSERLAMAVVEMKVVEWASQKELRAVANLGEPHVAC